MFDRRRSLKKPIFYIELKTGPGSTEHMRKFQLDLNDWNDVATVCNRYRHPAYFFHAKVVEEYSGPTRRSVGKGLWWTDCFTMDKNRTSIQPRRGEGKHAAFYDATVFRPEEEFRGELERRGYVALEKKLKKRRLRTLTANTVVAKRRRRR